MLLRIPVIPQTSAQTLFLPLLTLPVALFTALILTLAMILPRALHLSLPQRHPVLPILDLAKGSHHVCSLTVIYGILCPTTGRHNNSPGKLCRSQNLEHGAHVSHQRSKRNLSFSVKPSHVASVSSTTGRKRYEGLACFFLLKADLSFLGESIVVMNVSMRRELIVTYRGVHREPQTTWINSQDCKMALRVTSSDTDTKGC